MSPFHRTKHTFNPADWSEIQPVGQELLDRRLPSLVELEQWVRDCAALSDYLSEYGSQKNIDNACYTEDEKKEADYLDWIREIQPRLKPLFFQLQKRYLNNAQRHDLYDAGFAMLEMNWQSEVDLFREENIPLQTEESELSTEYSKLMGAMTVSFNDEELTLQQLAKYQQSVDRQERETTWRLAAERRLVDQDRLDELFNQQLVLRHQIAQQADFDDYRQYKWVEKQRFDYRPEDCDRFAESIEQFCVPLVNQLDEHRRQQLKVEQLRPWDVSVDVFGRAPLKPFEADQMDRLIEQTSKIFEQINPSLRDRFLSLQKTDCLDLQSRRGKRPGGFQASLEESRQPFIFMNAAGLQGDVNTLLHEGGHAFHYQSASSIWNSFVRHAPLEFCEVASMSMELLGADHFNLFYDHPEEAQRAKRELLEGVIRILPWIATIDQFQHWLYTHPGHSAEERTKAWEEVFQRFGSSVIDWTDLSVERETLWHRQLHLFQVPFYYIEYGIAQLGAVGVWLRYQQEPEKTLEDLFAAFELGGSRPLPELFQTAGIPFRFDQATVEPMIEAIGQALSQLAD